MKKLVIILGILFIAVFAHAQERVTTFGLQFKPIIPSDLLGTGKTVSTGSENNYEVSQKMGYSFGGVVRKGYTDWLSLETGINFVRRNYEARVFSASSQFSDSSTFGVIAYEIPVSALIFVRLSDHLYMDGAFGLAMDMFPSDVSTAGRHDSFYQRSFRNSWSKKTEVLPWLNAGLIANVGFEYRTDKAGYFYFGGSYHRPFKSIYNSFLIYDRNSVSEQGFLQLSGNYLTLDIKYFFHEEAEPRKAPKSDDETPAWMLKRKEGK